LEKIFVVKRVASKLHGTEAAIDAAMVQTAEMMSELVQARKDLGLSPTFGAEVTSKVIAAMSALSEAREAMVSAHADLEEKRLRLGVRTKMIGWDMKDGSLASASPSDQERVAEAS